ncbi:MAG: type II restriction endonuclease [Odoribacter sp.]|nr:type II restriction endonuclease [Odoribacter sp.]
MKLVTQSPKKALKPFLKQKPLRSDIDAFKVHLIDLLDKISTIEKRPTDESEEHLKNDLRDFLRDTYYKDINAINTKDKKDLVIHLGKSTDSEVGVIIEAKRPNNLNEMVSAENPNKKALHELILYYLDERNKAGNIQLKQLVITNINEWYIIDANQFDKHIYRNTQIQKLYETKINDKKDNPFFYEEIAKIIQKTDIEIPCIYFDIRDYNTILRNNKKEDDRELSSLFKILSPQHLLKIATPNDSNSLNERFYKELLHIIGLEEAKQGSKNIIRRKKENRNAASLLETTIDAINTEEVLHRLPDQSAYGTTREERIFNVSLELCITWINRILFLKLLEGQLVTYHQGNKAFCFLNTETIRDFDELFKLFHKVLAVNLGERSEAIKGKYSRVPYLNSSLFEISELEDQTIKINALDDAGLLELIGTTILKDLKKKADKLPTLDYLFRFLDAYDFASEGTDEVQEDNKTLINASVLGKVFEKINGYKDGSIFTPGFITMYMCKQSIRLAVVEKFNEALSEKGQKLFDKFEDVRNYTSRLFKTHEILNANQIINSLRICDPAVGSGHFLVSSLNEMISIKAELGILADAQGNSIGGYEIEIVNDELIITNQNGDILEYKVQNGKPLNKEMQRLQKTLFHEKQQIIENCLFGVDINPNSVKICRLRLWIELLKNAYYKEENNFTELETLPNIDINIKCGNSLVSRFAIDADLSKALRSIKYDIKAYRGFVNDYKNEKNREVKRGLQKIIDTIKGDFRSNIDDPFRAKIAKARGELDNVMTDLNTKQQWGEKIPKELKEKLDKVAQKLAKLEAEKETIENNVVYKNAFEWRFEFPEVLNDKGEFEGFDVTIGNPPYIRQEEIKDQKSYLRDNYNTYSGTADLYVFFVERGFQILKPKGHFSFIMPNKWMQAGYGKSLRSFLLKNRLLSVIDFGDLQVFGGVTTYPCILDAIKEKSNSTFNSIMVKTLQFDKEFEGYVNSNTNKMSLSDLSDENWVISSGLEQMILSRLKPLSISLSDYISGSSYRGILTGLTEAFLINSETKERLIEEDKNSEELIKSFLLGRNIKPYASSKADNWLILIPKGFTIKRNLSPDNPNFIAEPVPRYGNMHPEVAWEWFEKNYPAIARHLFPFKEKAEIRTDMGDFWWELRACDYYHEFESPKIMYQVMQVKPCFIYDENGQYCNNSMWIIPKDDKFLVGILNSKIGWWLISKYCTAIQNGYQLIWQYFGQIPIAKVSVEQKLAIEELVNQILTAKRHNPNIVTNDLERKIDELVYQLYELTPEEIQIIEGR